jgi:hypothetical protein
MVTVPSFTTKEGDMLDSGNKIKWKEKVFYTIQTTKLLIRVIGETINFTALAHYSTKNLKNFMDPLTIETGLLSKIIG